MVHSEPSSRWHFIAQVVTLIQPDLTSKRNILFKYPAQRTVLAQRSAACRTWNNGKKVPRFLDSKYTMVDQTRTANVTDKSAAMVFCWMSPPANGRSAFTYMCTICLFDAIIIYLNYSFSLTKQRPICEPPSHSSMVPGSCSYRGGPGPGLGRADRG